MSTKAATLVSRWIQNVHYWLLPGVCVLCRHPTGQHFDLCEHCHAQLRAVPHPCPRCALSLPAGTTGCVRCSAEGSPFAAALAPLAWAEPASALISRFKYSQHLASGRVLGSLLLHELRLHYAGRPLPQLIVPVPLHPARLRQRGYNQSLLLARQLGKALQVPCSASLLRRLRNTPPQQELDREQRLQNLQGAFALDAAEARRWQGVRSIAVVDDVVTTLSTARMVAQVLTAGLTPAPELHLWALARA